MEVGCEVVIAGPADGGTVGAEAEVVTGPGLMAIAGAVAGAATLPPVNAEGGSYAPSMSISQLLKRGSHSRSWGGMERAAW